VAIGLVAVNWIRPGEGLAIAVDPAALPPNLADGGRMGVSDVVLSLVSPNLVEAAAETRLLPLIVFAIAFSAALSTLGRTGEHVIAFFHGVNEGLMKLVIWLMYLAPVGIFALVAARLGQAGGGAGFGCELAAVGWHVATVIVGLALHFVFLMVVLRVVSGRGLSYLGRMLRALVTAFGTASSAATLPVTMECARENGVDRRAVRFVLPLGATVNMDGTALYEAAAALFIAQA
jgi:Na+/H+-dicarboxylate symporter